MAGASSILGRRIREMREAAGLAQSDITCVHRTHLGAIERGERNCTVDVLERLAGALRCNIADFFLPAPVGDTPPDRLGRNIAALAADAPEDDLETFQEIAVVYFRRTKGRKLSR